MQCKGIASHVQNDTDDFGEDTWSNALILKWLC